jgi:ComF family protein
MSCQDFLSKLRVARSQLAGSLLDLLLPKRCTGCEARWLSSHEGFWCEQCLDELSWMRSPLCPACGRPFPKSPSASDHLCGECIQSVYRFDTARSAALHSGVVRERINQLKFGSQLHYIPPLVELLEMTFRAEKSTATELIVPVPLHTRRLRQRGFNQAGLLARALGRRLEMPVRFDLLTRRSWTRPQTRLSRAERLENVKGAFLAPKPEEIEGKIVLLIDDVFTTGTTISECAGELKDAGALEVHALTVSRALPESKVEIG